MGYNWSIYYYLWVYPWPYEFRDKVQDRIITPSDIKGNVSSLCETWLMKLWPKSSKVLLVQVKSYLIISMMFRVNKDTKVMHISVDQNHALSINRDYVIRDRIIHIRLCTKGDVILTWHFLILGWSWCLTRGHSWSISMWDQLENWGWVKKVFLDSSSLRNYLYILIAKLLGA